MSQLNKTQLSQENQSNFPTNNTGFITADKLRGFNQDMIDSLVDEGSYNIDSASFSGSIAGLNTAIDELQLQSGSTILVAEEGVLLGVAARLNFVGDNITASLAGNVATINVNAGGGEGVGFPFTGSAEITGSLTITGSLKVSQQFTASLPEGYVWVGDSNNQSSLIATSSFTAAGTSGTSGVDGTSGVNGATGPAGSSGTSGVDGSFFGSSGTSGTTGPTGPAGTSGTSGVDGTFVGTNGTSGTSGVDGVIGSSGTSGVDGSSGTSGVDGTQGISGTSGTSGVDGSQGVSGTSGTSGVDGTQGISGTSGTSGVDGSSGTSAVDGSSGTSGVDGSSGTSGTSGLLILEGSTDNGVITYKPNGSGSVESNLTFDGSTLNVIGDAVIASGNITASNATFGGDVQVVGIIKGTTPAGLTVGESANPTTINGLGITLTPTAGENVTINGSLNITGDITASNARLNGDLFVDGDITARTLYVDSSSIIYTSGSTKFGDSLDDTHQFTGSVSITGSLVVDGDSTAKAGKFTNGLVVSGSNLKIEGPRTLEVNYIQQSTQSDLIQVGKVSGGTSEVRFGTQFNLLDFLDVFARTTNISGSLKLTGSLVNNSLSYPLVDGTEGQALTTDGAGNLSFTTISEVENVIITVKNVSGGSLLKGTPCFITGSGTAGNIAGVVAARADNPSLMPAGCVLAENLTAGQEGRAYLQGFINGVNTSTFNAGDEVYVGATGGYTNVRPTGTNLVQPLGYVEKVDALNGSGVITGPAYFFDLPNLAENNIWVGNSSGVAKQVSSGSFVETGSFNSYSASVAQRNTTDEGNLNTLSSSLSTRLTTDEGNLSTLSSSLSTRLTTDEGRIQSLESATGSYATTGSNKFIGNQQITGSIDVSGSYLITSASFTGSLIDNVTPTTTGIPEVKHIVSISSASFAALGTKDPNTLYVVTGSASVAGLSPYTGSVRGNVTEVTVASSTASFDFSLGNFFTVTLSSGTTHFDITNVLPGQTVSTLVSVVSGATASFSSNVNQASGESYVPTPGTAKDILTFVSFDSSDVYLANIKNLV